jgi:hypothetical protein
VYAALLPSIFRFELLSLSLLPLASSSCCLFFFLLHLSLSLCSSFCFPMWFSCILLAAPLSFSLFNPHFFLLSPFLSPSPLMHFLLPAPPPLSPRFSFSALLQRGCSLSPPDFPCCVSLLLYEMFYHKESCLLFPLFFFNLAHISPFFPWQEGDLGFLDPFSQSKQGMN